MTPNTPGAPVDTFGNTAEAFRRARRRAVVAAELQADLLYAAVREAGMSIRQATAGLRVPRRVVARQWRRRAPEHGLSVPGAAGERRAAWAAVWAHDPSEQTGAHIPHDGHDSPERGHAATTPPDRPTRRRPHTDHDR